MPELNPADNTPVLLGMETSTEDEMIKLDALLTAPDEVTFRQLLQ